MTALCALLVLSLAGADAVGDDFLRTAQQELRKRKLYFGPVDGDDSAATTAAIRRIQALKGIDQSGQLDSDTRRALGLPAAEQDALADKGFALVLQYLAARMGNDPEGGIGLFAETIDYFDDGLVERSFVSAAHRSENERWPGRRYTVINRVAATNPERMREVVVTARIRTEVSNATAQPRAATEDITFVMRQMSGGLRIVSLKRVE